MFAALKSQWQLLRDDRPGRRFTHFNLRHRERERGSMQKPLVMFAGTLLLLAGLVMLVFPGPGVLVALIGAGFVASESRWFAIALDQLEVRARRAIEPLRSRWRARGSA